MCRKRLISKSRTEKNDMHNKSNKNSDAKRQIHKNIKIDYHFTQKNRFRSIQIFLYKCYVREYDKIKNSYE